MAEDSGLSVARLSTLVSAALPVKTTEPAADSWATLEANAPPIEASALNTWLSPLQVRQKSLLLPEYASRYMTRLLSECTVDWHDAKDGGAGVATLTAFVSLVRHRFLSVSIWLTVAAANGAPDPKALSAAWANEDLVFKLDLGSELARLLQPSLGFDESLAAMHTAGLVADAALRLSGGRIVADETNAALHPDARFEATIATLADIPEGFAPLGKSNPTEEEKAEAEKKDLRWRYMAAELLPQIHGSHSNYRPEFLLDVLGTDMTDSSAGHYFLTRRRVLSLLDGSACEQEPRLMSNTVTWTQLLCENASIQLAAIRSNNERLRAHTDENQTPSRSARALIRSQFRLYQDLDEAQNVAISLDPVFWHHQETLKRISGLSTLSTSLSERFAAFVSASAVDEQRTFADTTRALTLVLGALALVAPTVQIAVEEESSVTVVMLLAIGSALVGALSGLMLLTLMQKRGRR